MRSKGRSTDSKRVRGDTSPRACGPELLSPGLFLTGQDVVTPGVTGAMMGGVLAASAIEPQVYPHIR